MRTSLFSRLGLAVGGAAVIAALGGAIAPVQASAGPPPPCFISNTLEKVGNQVVAGRNSICEDGITTGLPVSLQRQNASGQFVTIASGTGFAVHNCSGSSPRTYRKVQGTVITKSFACT